MKKNLESCPFCGSNAYTHKIKPMKLLYKSHMIVVQQPAYWCDICGEGVIGGLDRKATQKELQICRAKIDHLLTPDDIKKIRERLSLTQRRAGELFGGGINAFSRYERGETPVPKSLSQLFLLLDKHPNLLAEIV